MESNQRPQVPILSTAGAVPVKSEKGGISMQKVKVNRYVTGKRPDYAPRSSSEESDEEFGLKKPQQKLKQFGISKVKDEEGDEDDLARNEEVIDRRLRRLQELRKAREEAGDSDSDDSEDDRVARHRRQVIEPEVVAEGTDSEEEKPRHRDDEESSEEEEEELDEEEIERRRALLRQRARQRKEEEEKIERRRALRGQCARQRKEEEEVLGVEEEKSGESDEESSEYEEYSDSEEETGPRLKPIFVRKKDRITIQEKERNEAKAKDLEVEFKKQAEERRKQTLKVIEDERRREIEEARAADACDGVDSGDDNDEEAYEAWKVRELRRLKRDREEREQTEREKMEIERLHGLTEEERRAEFQKNPKQRTNKAPKGKYKFLQKYYHRGAFYMEQDTDVYKQDFSQPTLEDHFDKTVLPKVMQVKNFGRSGRTKYTHLVDQDTTSFDSPWVADTAMNIKFHSSKGGGMKQSFDRPSNKKKK